MKVFLSEIISPTQSVFVPRRMITNNILVTYECFHTIKKKRGGREGLCAIKLDMHKVCDWVEWPFLKGIMLELGFQKTWVDFIMQCVSNVEYRVRFSDE